MPEKKDIRRLQLRKAANDLRRSNKPHSEESHPPGFIPAEKSRLLGWIDSERITFWCWLFIRRASCSFLGKQIADLVDEDIPYIHFEVNSNPLNHDERLVAVKKYFEEMEKKAGHATAYEIMREMQAEWLVIADKTKDMSWLPRKEAVVCWAWDYVRKLPYFRKKSMSSWFQPVNVAEKRMAVIAVFDESFPDEYMYRHDFIKYRNHLIANMKAAYDKKMGNKNDKLRTQISVKISWHAKQRLDKLMRDRGATQQSIIEYLLLHGNLD
ncbi:hypothetical protein CSN29_26290 [Salmonella enterica subsp. diarizonae]|nr:hypothetical protein [Salmonella enterica]ECC3884278.1 hypothetical protein [Salmonella enterica subsp. diarizonae]ECJ4781696.1 hypothetical protein [Salmonella enterica subsp. diarizonae]EDQ7409357.1 hypothetical protein [Salmonella enterica subsp. diarizonae]EKG3508548.1 hypothetical protein [Salmonella enterica]